MSDHYHSEYAHYAHDHRGDYASEGHDHDVDYAEKHHRHYDDERQLASVRRDLDHVIRDLRDALERIRALERDTPQARQLQYEADLAVADLAASGYAEEEEP
jgi:hypothetical protein